MTSLPKKWIIIPLDDCGEWGSGGTPKRTVPQYYLEGTIPWLIIGDLNDGVVCNAATYITEEGLRNSSAKLLPVGTLLIAMYGSIGKLGITGFACATNQAIAFCKPNNYVDLKYLFYSLMNVRNDLITYGQGGAQQNISQTILRAYEIPLAPLNEQKRIADKLDKYLSRVDACREHLDRVPGIIKRFRQAVLSAAVSGQLTEEWRNKQTFSQREKLTWRNTTIDDLCESSFYGPRFGKNEYTNLEDGIPTIRTTDMTDDGRILITKGTPRVIVPLEKIEHFKVKPGDLLITRSGSIGTMAIVDNEDVAIPSAYLIRFRFRSEVYSRFIFYCLMSPSGQEQLGLSSTAITQPNVNAESIKRIKLRIPPLDEQREIIDRVEKLFELEKKVENKYFKSLELIEMLQPALLAKAFRGELVLQNTNDEPASVLLELIRVEKAKQADEPRRVGKRRPSEDKMTGDSVKEIIQKLPQDNFSFDELREKLSGDYDEIKNILFDLLAEPNPQIKQVFDKTTQAIRFIRID